jgi:MFS family permease
MSKATVSRIFIGSVIAVVAGAILAVVAVLLAYANGAFVMDGPDVVGIRGTAFAWTMVGLAIVAGFVVMGGFVGGLVSWIGALLNTSQLDDKTWFLVLLLLGIWNLGVVAMIAYLIAGPDGRTQVAVTPEHAPI